MALPGTSYVLDAFDEAFERIGFDPSGLEAKHVESFQRGVTSLLADWNTDTVDFWKVASQQTIALATNQTNFALAAGQIDVISAALRRDQLDTPMLIISREDWFAIPDKLLVRGMPNRVWVERLISYPPTAHIYPFSENNTDIFVYDALVQFNDSTWLGGAPDVPWKWIEAFWSGMAFKMAEKFAPARLAEKQALYGGPQVSVGAYARARSGDRERGDTVITMQRNRRRRR